MPTDPTRILALSTVAASHCARQETVARFLSHVLGEEAPSPKRDRALDLVERVFASSGIETRHSVIPDYGLEDSSDFRFYPKRWDLEPFPTTAERMRVYERASVDLAEEAGRRALSQACIDPLEVTHLLVCTCTGFFAPGPDILLIGRLGLAPTVSRTIIGFMGCHGGFNGLRSADQIVRAHPSAVVLQICVELCSLHYQKRPEPGLVVTNALFADGCAAVVYGSSGRFSKGLADLKGSASLVGRDSLDQMSWNIGDTGFEMHLDIALPRTLAEEAPAFLNCLLRKADLEASGVKGWALHPGGRRILECVGSALQLADDDLEASFSVLRDYGNMSSGTVFFVLERILCGSGRRGGTLVALGFGPGITLEGALLTPLHEG